MLLSLMSGLAYAGPSWTEEDVRAALVRAVADPEVRDAFAASVLSQADARPIGAFGGTLVYAVDLSAALADPIVDRSVSAQLDLDLEAEIGGQLGLLALPPQVIREVGAHWDDSLIDLAEATELDQRTDDIATVIVVGGAILLWGLAIDTAYDAFFPPPPPPPAPPPPPPGDQKGPVDTTPNGCVSATDCDGDGLSNYVDPDDDNDGVDDLEPDYHPYDSTQKICDLCGGTPYPQGAFSFFLGQGDSLLAESLITGALTDAAHASAVSLGTVADSGFELFAP